MSQRIFFNLTKYIYYFIHKNHRLPNRFCADKVNNLERGRRQNVVVVVVAATV